MDFDGSVKNLGRVEISTIKDVIQGLTFDEWDLDSRVHKKLAGRRPGNALFVLRDTILETSMATYEEMLSGSVNVCSGGGWHLLHKPTMNLIVNYVMPAYPDCSPMRVQYVQLSPGEKIPAHVDLSILAHVHRLHVPILTEEGVQFIVGHEKFFLEEGFLYELNNSIPHSVENSAGNVRVHLIIDLLPNDSAEITYHLTNEDFSNGKCFQEFFSQIAENSRPDYLIF